MKSSPAWWVNGSGVHCSQKAKGACLKTHLSTGLLHCTDLAQHQTGMTDLALPNRTKAMLRNLRVSLASKVTMTTMTDQQLSTEMVCKYYE